jgi:hypothetical protein
MPSIEEFVKNFENADRYFFKDSQTNARMSVGEIIAEYRRLSMLTASLDESFTAWMKTASAERVDDTPRATAIAFVQYLSEQR